jgi:hypothetical protein
MEHIVFYDVVQFILESVGTAPFSEEYVRLECVVAPTGLKIPGKAGDRTEYVKMEMRIGGHVPVDTSDLKILIVKSQCFADGIRVSEIFFRGALGNDGYLRI